MSPILLLALLAAPPAPAPAPAPPPQVRRERLERGLERQRQRLEQVREKPEAFNLQTEKPGVHFLFDAAGNCTTEERLGAVGDGGKWVCNAHRIAAQKPCVAYGFGAGSDISFEEALAQDLGCEVHVFDPSPRAVKRFGDLSKGKAYGAGSVTFHAWGLGPVSRDPAKALDLVIEGKACEVRTLDGIAQALGHRRVDLLKMDIEGSEWSVFDDAFKKGLLETLQVKDLLAELHVQWGAVPKDLIDLVEALAARGYVLHRKEFNPWSPGSCAEYAFARKDFLLE